MPPFSFFQLWLARNWSARLVANEESFQHVASSDSSGTARKTTSKNIEGKCGEGKRKTGSCGHTQQKLLPPTYWPPACGFQLSTIENERVERLNSFQNWWKRLRRPLRHGFLLFMQSFRSSRGHFTWEKYCSVLFLRDFNLQRHSWKISDRRHVAFIICVRNVQCLQQPVKIDRSNGIPDPAIRELSFVNFNHRRFFASLAALLPSVFVRRFRAMPQLFSTTRFA